MTPEQTSSTHPDSQLLTELEDLLARRRYEGRAEGQDWLDHESCLGSRPADSEPPSGPQPRPEPSGGTVDGC